LNNSALPLLFVVFGVRGKNQIDMRKPTPFTIRFLRFEEEVE
jgi:hypothetical protein